MFGHSAIRGASNAPLRLITEHHLRAFQQAELTPARMMGALAKDRTVLLNLQPGGGKSTVLDDMLVEPATFAGDRLVVVLGPAWELLQERAVFTRPAAVPVPWTALERRPSRLCGKRRDEAWRHHEQRNTIALGRARICSACPHMASGACPWPERFSRTNLDGKRIVVATEAHLLAMPGFVHLIHERTGAGQVLVIVDEARISASKHEVLIERQQVELLRQAIRMTKALPANLAADWEFKLGLLADAIIAGDDASMAGPGWDFGRDIERYAVELQDAGVSHDPNFKNILPHLYALADARPWVRWCEPGTAVRFPVKPFLDAPMLILGANLQPAVLEHRWHLDRVAPLFADVRIVHTGTRFINIRDTRAMKTFFRRGQHVQILQFIAVLIFRNIAASKQTLLVASKEFKGFCADELKKHLAALGIDDVKFVVDHHATADLHDVRTIPIINYGTIGVNYLRHIDAAYCLNSYYVPSEAIAETVQDDRPGSQRVPLAIGRDEAGNRRVMIGDLRHTNTDLAALADRYHFQMEIDPVVQAVSRVRPFNQPREIVTFQLNDLTDVFPGVVDVGGLEEARRELGVPKFVTLRSFLVAEQARGLIASGASIAEAAVRLGVSRASLGRWLLLKNPFMISMGASMPEGGTDV